MEKALTKVTPSQLGMLMECPRCAWLYFKRGLARPMGPFPSLPGGFDLLFKNYFDSFRSQDLLPPELAGKVEEKLFPGMEKLRIWRSNMQGIRAEFPEYNILLKGAIDEMLVANSGDLVVLDFKTRGYPVKEDSHTYYQTQLDLYALLFDKNGYRVAPYGYLLFFWPSSYAQHGSKFETELVKVATSPQGGRRALENLKEILAREIPPSASRCEFCRYRTFREE